MNDMKNIVLIGFMGTGKTSTGKLLANRMGYSFVDTDAKIEQECQMSIKEMFAVYGEAYFREREAKLAERLADGSNAVISTGGGVVLNPENMKFLRRNGVIVCLKAAIDVIVERTGRRSSRPLLEKEDRLKAVSELLRAREPLYAQADFSLDTSGISPLQATEDILEFIKRERIWRARS